MIYLTFDTDIWLNLIRESGQDYNSIDIIEFWIENGDISILLPEIILVEWEKNRASKAATLNKDWKAFYNRVQKILGKGAINGQNTPENIKDLVDNQLKRVELIFENNAIKIPITDEFRIKASHIAFAKEKPFGSKNSMGDALIYLAMSDYIENNALQNCVFVTDNFTDYSFSEKEKHKVHTDLKTFTTLNIEYFCGLNRFLNNYTNRLSDFNEYKKLKSLKEESIKLANAVLNPQSIDNITGLRDSYIENINFLNLIINNKTPTREQVHFVLSLIDSNENYKQYFFRKVENGLWFRILKLNGYLNPKKNRIQPTFWEPIFYLEKLSNQIKEGRELELIDELVEVIKSISESFEGNDNTWYIFANIISNLPNNIISKNILNLIPKWIKSSTDTTLLTSVLCETLLPKFLFPEPNNEDIEKVEKILKYLFSIEKIECVQNNQFGIHGEKYYSKFYLHFIKDALIEKKLVARIASYCSNDVIMNLADNLKKLYFDFPYGINVTFFSNSEEFKIHIDIVNKDLVISVIDQENHENVINTTLFSNFEDFNEGCSKNKIITNLKELNIEYFANRDNEFNLNILINALMNGSEFSSFDNSVSNLNDRYHHDDKVGDVLALIFRDILNEKIKVNIHKGLKLLNVFAFENKYRLSFYRRIVLYIISENWDVSNKIFWELVKDDDINQIFSNNRFNKELYELLNKNQLTLTIEEIKLLKNIIDKGPQGHKESDDLTTDFWKQRWNSALRNIEPFKSEYFEQLKSAKNLTAEYYEHLGEVEFRNLSESSPLSSDEILKKSNEEIAKFLVNFKPKDRWVEPTIEGLSNALGEAIEREPQRFSLEINLFKDAYYIYVYHILNGFKEAWKNKRIFNWGTLLVFCKNYIEVDKFYKDQLKIENDGWGATSDWVAGSIGSLLTEGMQSDNNAFELELLPLAKEILKTLTLNLKSDEEFKQSYLDYPTYTLNSTAGKILRSLLDYSLRRAKNLKSENSLPKWEEDIKTLYDNSLGNGIIDSYIQLGLYFKAFYFLDKEWLIIKIKHFYLLDDKEWLAFIGGLTFGNPLFDNDIYILFYPHYERAIKNNVKLENSYQLGIIRHIVAFLFWGFEDLKTEGLLILFLENAKSSSILELVNFIWRQEDYFKGLNASKAKKIEKAVNELWSYLADKYKNSEDENDRKVLEELSNLLVFVPQLDNFNTKLVLITCKQSGNHFKSHYLIEDLVNLKAKGNPLETAKYIGQILYAIPSINYFSNDDNLLIIDLVTFLYENDQKDIANDICDKITKLGFEFLIEVHNKYKD